jgi:hypothetical protein
VDGALRYTQQVKFGCGRVAAHRQLMSCSSGTAGIGGAGELPAGELHDLFANKTQLQGGVLIEAAALLVEDLADGHDAGAQRSGPSAQRMGDVAQSGQRRADGLEPAPVAMTPTGSPLR